MVLKDVKIKILTDSISLQVFEPETPLHGLLVNMAHAWKFCCKEKPDDFTYMFQQSRDGVALKTWELRSFEYHGVETLGNTVSRPSFYLLESGWAAPGNFSHGVQNYICESFCNSEDCEDLENSCR